MGGRNAYGRDGKVLSGLAALVLCVVLLFLWSGVLQQAWASSASAPGQLQAPPPNAPQTQKELSQEDAKLLEEALRVILKGGGGAPPLSVEERKTLEEALRAVQEGKPPTGISESDIQGLIKVQRMMDDLDRKDKQGLAAMRPAPAIQGFTEVLRLPKGGQETVCGRVDTDGGPGIVTATDGEILVYNTKGEILSHWAEPNLYGYGLHLVEADGDPRAEILVETATQSPSKPAPTPYEQLHGLTLYDTDGTLIWEQKPTVRACAFLAAGDVNGDGKDEFVVFECDTDPSQPFVKLLSTAGTELWKKPWGSSLATLRGDRPRVAVGDVDGDGKPDVVIGEYGYSVFRTDGTEITTCPGEFLAVADIAATSPGDEILVWGNILDPAKEIRGRLAAVGVDGKPCRIFAGVSKASGRVWYKFHGVGDIVASSPGPELVLTRPGSSRDTWELSLWSAEGQELYSAPLEGFVVAMDFSIDWLNVGDNLVLTPVSRDLLLALDSKGKQVAKAEGMGQLSVAGTLKVAGKPAVVVTATLPPAFGEPTQVIAYTIGGP
jgi:hypothetical protein